MLAKGLTPILNVSNIQESFAWFEKLGWTKGWDWAVRRLSAASARANARSFCVRAVKAVGARVSHNDVRPIGRRNRRQRSVDVHLGG